MTSSHQGHQELSQGLHQGPHHHDTISNQHIIYNIPSIPLNHQVCGSKGLFKVFFTIQDTSSIKGSTSTSIHYHKDIFKVTKASTCQPRLLQGFQDSIKPSITMQATNDHFNVFSKVVASRFILVGTRSFSTGYEVLQGTNPLCKGSRYCRWDLVASMTSCGATASPCWHQ